MVGEDLLEFTKRVREMLSAVANTHRIKVIHFLNISEQIVLEKMVAKLTDVAIIFAGGFEFAQRKRAAIFPVFMAAESINTLVSIFKIEVIGAGEITHSQVLGSLMGLNIDRNVIGDIMVDENGAFFAVASEFDRFIQENFTKVGRFDIRLELIKEPVAFVQQFEDFEIILSSMRLDVVVKALINASRGKAEEYLEAGYVRLNHVALKKGARVCQIGDTLSIRKHGRFKLVEIKKTTKRGKFVVVVSKSV